MSACVLEWMSIEEVEVYSEPNGARKVGPRGSPQELRDAKNVFPPRASRRSMALLAP